MALRNTASRLAGMRTVLLSSMDSRNALIAPQKKFDVNVKGMASYNNSFEALTADLKRYKKNGYRVLLLSGSAYQGKAAGRGSCRRKAWRVSTVRMRTGSCHAGRGGASLWPCEKGI